MKRLEPAVLAIALLTLLAFLSGCAILSSTKTEFVPAEWLGKGKPSPRPTPAQVTQESAEALKAKGFVMVGQISKKVVTGTYWGSKLHNKPESRDITTGLLRLAADHGGDVIVLQQNNSAEQSPVTKRGRALTWIEESRTELYQTHNYTGDPGVQASRTVYYRVPTSWETINGTEYSVVSSGTIWRNDPDLLRQFGEWEKAAPERAKAAAERQKAAEALAKQERIAARQKQKRSALYTGYIAPDRGALANGLKVFMNDDELYGYADRQGLIAIKPQYKWAGNFSDGLAQALVEGKRAYIDQSGKPALVLQLDCQSWKDFSEGLARVGVGSSLTDQKWGYIDRTGKLVIPAQFDTTGDFSDGLAWVRIKGNPDQYGYIDKQGRYAIPLRFYSADSFHDGLAPVTMLLHPGIKQGYIDHSGNWVISDSKFIAIREFSEGLAPVEVNIGTEKKWNYKWGYIDKEGKWAIQPQFDEASPFSDGMARVMAIKGFDKKKYGFIDRTGKLVIEPVYDKANDFRDGLAVVWPVFSLSLEDFSVKTTSAKIINKKGESVGELDVFGAIHWNSQSPDKP
jgi:hypothetical protein